MKEGEEGEYFYIIEDGTVECLKDPEEKEGELVFVRELKKGDHFGELALIKSINRTMSIRVKSVNCTVLALGRNAF